MKKVICFSVLFLLLLVLNIAAVNGEVVYSVSGYAFLDEDGSLTDTEESRLSGVPVSLIRYEDNAIYEELHTQTDSEGHYSFSVSSAGNYRVCADYAGENYLAVPVGETSILNSSAVSALFSLNNESASANVDIAVLNASPVTISAFVDSNKDSTKGKYDASLAGVKAEVQWNGSILETALTDNSGLTRLQIPQCCSTLTIVLPDGYAFSPAGNQNDASSDTQSAVMLLTGKDEYSVAAYPVGSLSGTVFEDVNNNGVWDEEEPGVPGITIHLSSEKLGVSCDAVSDENGRYSFGQLRDGTYTITATLPDGLLYARYSRVGGDLRSIFSGETLEREFKIKNSAALTDKNIGVIQKGIVSGTAFLDLNYNGYWDADEPGYEGVTIEVSKFSDGTVCGKTVTDKNGSYSIENLRGGNYRVRAILPNDGSIFSAVGEGSFADCNRFEQRASRREYTVQTITIDSGGNATVLVGVALGATVSGTVFQDENYNGILDKGEKTFSGLKVMLLDESGNIAAQDSVAAKGGYSLSGVMPGNYTLKVQRKSGFGFTRCRSSEKNGSYITKLQDNFGLTETIHVTMGDNIEGINAGMLPSATLSGKIFDDANGNGSLDNDESGMFTATVHLVSEDAEADLSAAVSQDGSFFFDGLMPGSYTLTYELAPYCRMNNGYENQLSLTITMGDTVTVPDVLAETLGSFVGFVSDSQTGKPVSGAVITIGSYNCESQSDGSFRIENLEPGDYSLTVQLPQGLIFAYDTDAYGLNWPISEKASQSIPWSILTDRSEKQINVVVNSSVSGTVWMDENRDGVQSSDEWIMEGLTVELWKEDNDSAISTVVSGKDGFCFSNVRPGKYSVRFVLPEQSEPAGDAMSTFIQSGESMVQNNIIVKEGSEISGLTTGLVSLTSIGGQMILEADGTRTAIAGVSLQLTQNGLFVAHTDSDENGNYQFDGLWPGEYTVECILPTGTVFVRYDDPNYTHENLFIEDSKDNIGTSSTVVLEMAQHQLNHDILLIKPGKVGDQAWLDSNENGLIDAGEPYLCGVKVSLLQDGNVQYEAVTNEQGYYLINNVYPGEYVLEASAYEQLEITTRIDELAIISTCLINGNGSKAQSDPFTVESGSNCNNMDLGYVLPDGAALPDEAIQEVERDWSDIHNNTIDGIV